MAAHGSGAAARSIRDKATVMNVDVGGGTSKIAVCADGRVTDLTALDVGARLVCLDAEGRIVRVEEAGRRFAAELGIDVTPGAHLAPEDARALAAAMADRLFEAMGGGSPYRRRACCGSIRCRQRTHDRPSHLFRRRCRIHLRPRGADLRRSRRAPCAGNPRPHGELAREARAGERGHPRDRDRRVAIHHAGERQHHLRLAARRAAAAQRAGHRAGLRARRRRDRFGRRRRGDQGGAQAARPRGSRHAGGGVRAVARLRHLPAARRLLRGRGRRPRAASSPTAIRWCWQATATSAG